MLKKMNLQLFADEGEENEDVEEVEEEEEEKNTTYTKDELEQKIQSESDKRVTDALKTARAKWEREYQEKIEDEKTKAAEYARMTAKEKEEAELKEKINELEERERELINRELLNEIQSDLKENQLPLQFAESLLAIQDNKKIKEAIKGIKKDFDLAVNEQVKEALRQDTPNSGGDGDIELDPFTKAMEELKNG